MCDGNRRTRVACKRRWSKWHKLIKPCNNNRPRIGNSFVILSAHSPIEFVLSVTLSVCIIYMCVCMYCRMTTVRKEAGCLRNAKRIHVWYDLISWIVTSVWTSLLLRNSDFNHLYHIGCQWRHTISTLFCLVWIHFILLGIIHLATLQIRWWADTSCDDVL